MTQLRAILVSVDYSDILQYTLPWNRHHFSEVLIVTSHHDVSAHTLALRNGCRFFATNAFTRNGAVFNKWLALEEGLDHFGRWGWTCLMDADVLWPKVIPQYPMERGHLYSPLRRMYENFSDWVHAPNPYHPNPGSGAADLSVTLPFPPENQWRQYPVHRNVSEWAGYTQIFHAEDPHLGLPPWHQVDWTHAGGADSFFQFKWPPARKVRPPFEVLHLGPAGRNWCGRSTPYLDGSRHPQAEVRAHRVRELFRGRIGKQGDQRFDHERLK